MANTMILWRLVQPLPTRAGAAFLEQMGVRRRLMERKPSETIAHEPIASPSPAPSRLEARCVSGPRRPFPPSVASLTCEGAIRGPIVKDTLLRYDVGAECNGDLRSLPEHPHCAQLELVGSLLDRPISPRPPFAHLSNKTILQLL